MKAKSLRKTGIRKWLRRTIILFGVMMFVVVIYFLTHPQTINKIKWYLAYQKLSEHTTKNGIDYITHSRDERQQIRNLLVVMQSDQVVSSTESELWCSNEKYGSIIVRDYDPYNPGIAVGISWQKDPEKYGYYPEEFPFHVGDKKEEVFEELGITDEMISGIDYIEFYYLDELKGVSVNRYLSDNAFAGLSFQRTDHTSIELSFSSEGELDVISFYDRNDYSSEAGNLVNELTERQKQPIEWDSNLPIEVGDVVRFGRYEQNNSTEDGMEDILWYAVASEGDELLLVSCKGLDFVAYGEDTENRITWSGSNIRHWLQSDFYEQAFNREEQNVILTKTLETIDQGEYSETVVGEKTKDTVFLLSQEEADQYLSTDQRPMLVTEYAKQKSGDQNLTTCGSYSRSYNSRQADVSGHDEYGNKRGYFCSDPLGYTPPVAVRPAVWIRREQANII